MRGKFYNDLARNFPYFKTKRDDILGRVKKGDGEVGSLAKFKTFMNYNDKKKTSKIKLSVDEYDKLVGEYEIKQKGKDEWRLNNLHKL